MMIINVLLHLTAWGRLSKIATNTANDPGQPDTVHVGGIGLCVIMKDNYKQELTDRFVELIEHLNRQMHNGRLDEWDALDMTIPQVKTLVLLERRGPLRMGGIARYLGTTLSATTPIVDRLVEKGLVERLSDPSDRRVVICELTAPGREATQGFWRIGRERILMAADNLEVEQLETALRGLEVLRRAEEGVQRTLASMQSNGSIRD